MTRRARREEPHHEAWVARNAAEALAPGGMNGSKLAFEAQRIRPGLKVLLTSGYVDNLNVGQVIGRGELAVLNKPCRRDELARSLRLILGGGKG
jgi:hypothetical protein